jgi:hypothetical protein
MGTHNTTRLIQENAFEERWRQAVPSYASIIWIRFLGRRRSRVALSAFVCRRRSLTAAQQTGWLPDTGKARLENRRRQATPSGLPSGPRNADVHFNDFLTHPGLANTSQDAVFFHQSE